MKKKATGDKTKFVGILYAFQTPEFGGGEIYFDDVLIRKYGGIMIPKLECLNPENLI